MFAILSGLMTLLVVLGATINSRFDGGSIEKALVGLLCAPMLAFGHSVEFSKGWLMGVASAALIGLLLLAGGLPLLFSLLFLGVACAAFWDREGQSVEVCVAGEYLDDADFTRLIELGKRGLALQLADWLTLSERGNLLRLEDEREAARLRIAELEADNLRLVAQLAQAYKPKPEELIEANEELATFFIQITNPADVPDPGWRPEPAYA